MRVVLFILAMLSFLLGFVIFVGAKSAAQEIEALVMVLISAVFLVGASIVDAVIHMGGKTLEATTANRYPPT